MTTPANEATVWAERDRLAARVKELEAVVEAARVVAPGLGVSTLAYVELQQALAALDKEKT